MRMGFKERLKDLREKRGLTQHELADLAGVSPATVGMYERGERQDPSGSNLVRLARVLGVSSAYLIGETDDPVRDDRLPEGWETVVADAIKEGLSPDELRQGMELVLLARRRSQNQKS